MSAEPRLAAPRHDPAPRSHADVLCLLDSIVGDQHSYRELCTSKGDSQDRNSNFPRHWQLYSAEWAASITLEWARLVQRYGCFVALGYAPDCVFYTQCEQVIYWRLEHLTLADGVQQLAADSQVARDREPSAHHGDASPSQAHSAGQQRARGAHGGRR